MPTLPAPAPTPPSPHPRPFTFSQASRAVRAARARAPLFVAPTHAHPSRRFSKPSLPFFPLAGNATKRVNAAKRLAAGVVAANFGYQGSYGCIFMWPSWLKAVAANDEAKKAKLKTWFCHHCQNACKNKSE